jgi:nitroreductase
MFPKAWWVSDPAKAPHVERLLGETIAGAPMVIVVMFDPTERAPASEGDVLGMISLGCVLENMWLAAQVSHLDVQVMSAFSGEVTEPQIMDILGVPQPWRVAYALRLGHAVAPAEQLRVRRDPETFVHRNHFA